MQGSQEQTYEQAGGELPALDPLEGIPDDDIMEVREDGGDWLADGGNAHTWDSDCAELRA